MRQTQTDTSLFFFQYTISEAASPLREPKIIFPTGEKTLDKTVSLCYCIINVIQ